MHDAPDIPDHELLRLIGRGAYGEVWLARNVMGVMRAVKVVRKASFQSPRPFEREFAAVKRYEPVSRTAAGLVNVLHAGRAPDGSHFHYVMELADCAEPGVDAATEPDKYVPCSLRLQIGRMGRLPVSECLETAVSLANGVADLHRVGLVHRDVKPSNIIFSGGRAKLADIGLVGDISESRSYVGTEGYVPPEGPGQPGADLYALGRVLYEMVTGFEATRFPALPQDWAQQENAGAFEFYEVVMRCCEPDAGRRYQTADQLLADLALLQSGQSVRQVRQLRGSIALLRKLALAAVTLGLVASAAAWWQGREAEAQRSLVARAEKAEAEARQHLYESLVQQARNARRGGEPEARFTALALLEKAASLNVGAPELREEFISALAAPGLQLISGEQEERGPAAFDGTLQYALTAGESSRLSLWRLGEAAPLSTWEVPGVKSLTPVRVTENGKTCFARDEEGRLLAWTDGQAAEPVRADGAGNCHWTVDAAGTGALGWQADGSVTRVSLTGDGTRSGWRSAGGFQAGYDNGSAVSANGKRAAFCKTQALSVVIHELPGGRPLQVLTTSRPLSSAAAFSADGSLFAAGFADGGVGIWRLPGATGPEIIEAGTSYVSGLAVSPDGRFLVSTSWAGVSWLWDLADGTRLCRTPLPAGVPGFSADGRRLVLHTAISSQIYAFEPGAACLSAVLPRQAITSREGTATRFSLHPGGAWLVVPRTGGLVLVDARRAAGSLTLPILANDAVFSGDGASLLLCGQTCTRIPVAADASGAWLPGLPQVIARNPGGRTLSYLRTTADAATILGWRDDRVWSVLGKAGPEREFPMPDGASEFFSLHPAGHWLAHGFRQAGVQVVSTADGAVIRKIPGTGNWSSCAFSPDGESLAVCDGAAIRLLKSGTWQELWRSTTTVNSAVGRVIAFAPSGRWLIHSPGPGCLALLETTTGRTSVSLRRDRDTDPAHFAMSADGGQLWELHWNTQTLWRWDIASLRTFLRARGLDWTDAALPPPIAPPAAARE